MAGITFTIGDVSFEAMSSASGRKARTCDPGYSEPQLHKFHLPGTTGNLVIMGGTGARTLRFAAQYRAADSAALGALLTADRAEWKDQELTCVTDDGETVTRCIVMDVKRGRIQGTGRDGVVKCEVEIIVQSNAGA